MANNLDGRFEKFAQFSNGKGSAQFSKMGRKPTMEGWTRKGRRGRWMALASVSWRGYRSFVRRFNFSWRARPRHHHPRRWMPRSYLVRGGSQPVFLYSPFPARALANEPLLRGHFIPRLSFRLFLPSPFSPISTKLRALRRACTTLGTLAFHERNNVYASSPLRKI